MGTGGDGGDGGGYPSLRQAPPEKPTSSAFSGRVLPSRTTSEPLFLPVVSPFLSEETHTVGIHAFAITEGIHRQYPVQVLPNSKNEPS